jgi:hypothetical protein
MTDGSDGRWRWPRWPWATCSWGWQGVVLAVSRASCSGCCCSSAARCAPCARPAGAPVGHVDSAVMLQARLKKGLRLMDIILLTRSLGEKLADDPETFRWTDAGGAA